MTDNADSSTFDGFRRSQEPVPIWLERVLAQPYQGLDTGLVQSKMNDISTRREDRNRQLLQDFNAACLDLLAWASRPPTEHASALSEINSKIHKANSQSAEQEHLKQQLLQFAQTIQSALGILMQLRGPSTPQNEAHDGPKQGDETAPVPTVLAPNSSPTS